MLLYITRNKNKQKKQLVHDAAVYNKKQKQTKKAILVNDAVVYNALKFVYPTF